MLQESVVRLRQLSVAIQLLNLVVLFGDRLVVKVLYHRDPSFKLLRRLFMVAPDYCNLPRLRL